MNIEQILGPASRRLAGIIFPDHISRDRSLSQMTADYLGTDTRTVHIAGGLILGGILLASLNTKK